MRAKIGLSLPNQYLCGDYGCPAAELFFKALGPVDRTLVRLGRENIECIELSSFGSEASKEQILAAVKNVWRAGLQVSLHPNLPDVPQNGGMDSQYPWLDELLREIPDFQEELVFTVHARSSERGKLKDYHDQTVKVLKGLAAEMENRGYPIRFALELNRSKGRIDPSTTYAGVLDICREIDSSRVGICWDWGHARANVLSCGLRPAPPAEFLRRVINTHAHELGPDGRPHWPLARSSESIERNMCRLENVRYSGCLTLELHPHRFAHQLDLKKAVRISVGCLVEAIHSVCGQTRCESRRTKETV